MKINEMIKVWRSNATSKGENIPVGLLQAQLLDASNVLETFTNLNSFEGVPMKVLIDYLTVNLIDELKIEHLFNSALDTEMFRSKVDRALWHAKAQTEGGKWYDEAQKS